MNDGRTRHSGLDRRQLLWFLVLSLLAVLGNYVALPIGFNVDFIFGSIFGLIAVVLLGPVPGIAVSAVGASYTFALWNHPYAIVIFGCEAAWVALARRKRPELPIIIVDAAYWALLGIPLVFVFYFGVMHMGLRDTAIVAMKQSLNGISNAVLASVLLNVLPLWRWVLKYERPLRRNAQLYFESMAFLLLIPCIGGLILMNRQEIGNSLEGLSISVHRTDHEVSWLLSDWMSRHLRATGLLATIGQQGGFQRSEAMQRQVAQVRELFPDFHNVFVADGTATAVAFDPPLNARGEPTVGLSFSDREWFQRLEATGKPVFSDVIVGRGGIAKPIVTVGSPIVVDGELAGFGLGATNLERLRSQLVSISETSNFTITVLDRRGAIVVSTDARRAPLEQFDIEPSAEQPPFARGVFLSMPESAGNVSVMRAWRSAVFFTKTSLADTGWTLVVEGALGPLQQRVYRSTMLNIAAIFGLLIAAGGASFWLSGRLSRPIGELAAISADLPDRIESGDRIAWPSSETAEIVTLAANFKATAEALRQKIHSLKDHNVRLESVVAERTAELAERAKEAGQAKAILQSIFDSAPMAIGWTDARLRPAYVNALFLRDVGYGLDEIPTLRHWLEKAYPDPAYREETLRRWTELERGAREAGGTSFGPLESWIQCKDGAKRCFAIYGSTLPDTRLAIFTDVTERKVNEEKLDAYARSQKTLVQEVNHRVKNNLALLVGMLHIEAARLGESDACRRVVDDIERRVRALSDVHSMLSLNEWRPIALRSLCQTVIAGALSKERSPRVEVSECDIVVAASQAHNIALVLNELATNSAKYATREGRIHVTVDLSSAGRMARITYRDHGPGYPEALIDGAPDNARIGIQLIRGIVKGSLYGSVTFSNHDGAVADIRFEMSAEGGAGHEA